MTEVFLGAIALATVVMAIIQVGAIVYAGRLARRVDRLSHQLEHELKPLLVQVSAVTHDASRVAALAAAQMERFDRLFADFADRATQTMALVQNAIVAPAREGMAIAAGLRAAVAAIRELRRRGPGPGGRVEEEDALFI